MRNNYCTTSSLHILDSVLQSTVKVHCGVFSVSVVCVAHMPCFSPLAVVCVAHTPYLSPLACVGSESMTQFLLYTSAGNNTGGFYPLLRYYPSVFFVCVSRASSL